MARNVPGSVIEAWAKYFMSVHPMKGRDYAVGFLSRGGLKRLKRIAYVDLDHFLDMARSDWKKYGQYLSIHDFEHRLYNEDGQYIGVHYHISKERSVKPSFLAHLYIDIEPKKDGVDEKQTFETLTRLVGAVRDRLGATPLVMQTRPGRYGVIYILRKIDLNDRSYNYAQLLYRELWFSLIDLAGLRDMVNITIDPQVKDLCRVTRVPYTFHEVTGKMIAPIEIRGGRTVFLKARDFDMGLYEPVPDDFVDEIAKRVEDELRKRAEEIERMRKELVMRRLERVVDYDSIDAMDFLAGLFTRSRTAKQWREVVAPDVGRVRYHPKLEGWGWIATLVKERIPIPDARMTFCWLTLPWAVKKGLVSEHEAREYLMFTVSFFPDKDFDEYWAKYEENRKYEYTAPTWRSLVTMVRKDGAPISDYNEHLRAAVLAALETVDYIVIFGEPDPLKIIEKVKPDILVKGQDWADKGVVGRRFVESAGGKVVLAPLVEGKSSTSIIEKMQLVQDRRNEPKDRRQKGQ